MTCRVSLTLPTARTGATGLGLDRSDGVERRDLLDGGSLDLHESDGVDALPLVRPERDGREDARLEALDLVQRVEDAGPGQGRSALQRLDDDLRLAPTERVVESAGRPAGLLGELLDVLLDVGVVGVGEGQL